MRLIDADWLREEFKNGYYMAGKFRMPFPMWIDTIPTVEIPPHIETNLYDKIETHENCTVEILHNTSTGEYSVGWWDNE